MWKLYQWATTEWAQGATGRGVPSADAGRGAKWHLVRRSKEGSERWAKWCDRILLDKCRAWGRKRGQEESHLEARVNKAGCQCLTHDGEKARQCTLRVRSRPKNDPRSRGAVTQVSTRGPCGATKGWLAQKLPRNQPVVQGTVTRVGPREHGARPKWPHSTGTEAEGKCEPRAQAWNTQGTLGQQGPGAGR